MRVGVVIGRSVSINWAAGHAVIQGRVRIAIVEVKSAGAAPLREEVVWQSDAVDWTGKSIGAVKVGDVGTVEAIFFDVSHAEIERGKAEEHATCCRLIPSHNIREEVAGCCRTVAQLHRPELEDQLRGGTRRSVIIKQNTVRNIGDGDVLEGDKGGVDDSIPQSDYAIHKRERTKRDHPNSFQHQHAPQIRAEEGVRGADTDGIGFGAKAIIIAYNGGVEGCIDWRLQSEINL